MKGITAVCVTVFLIPALVAAADPPAADVVVYGGTSAGVTAAVEAARLGRKVVLVESGRHLGGMSSSGLGMESATKRSVRVPRSARICWCQAAYPRRTPLTARFAWNRYS